MRPSSSIQVAWIHLAFVLTGVLTTLLGPILPELSLRWSLSDSQAGAFFAAQFLGSSTGVIVSSLLTVRRGFRITLGAGLVMMAAGVALLGSLGSWVAAAGSVFCYGIGLGLVIPAGNVWIASANPTRRGSALSLLNLSWGIGAVACPFLVALAQRAREVSALLFGLVGFLILLALPAASRSFGLSEVSSEQIESLGPSVLPVWRSHSLVALGALFFLYVGTENAVGGWVATYAQRLSSSHELTWLLTPSLFWGALLLGRALAPLILKRAAEPLVLRWGLLLGGVGVAVLLVAESPRVVLAGATLTGLGLATVFPLLVSLLAQLFGVAAQQVAGVLFAAAGFGGATLPWLVGAASTHFANLKAGLTVPLLGTLVMLVLHMTTRATSMKNLTVPR